MTDPTPDPDLQRTIEDMAPEEDARADLDAALRAFARDAGLKDENVDDFLEESMAAIDRYANAWLNNKPGAFLRARGVLAPPPGVELEPAEDTIRRMRDGW